MKNFADCVENTGLPGHVYEQVALLEQQIFQLKIKNKQAAEAILEIGKCLEGMVYSGPLAKSWVRRSRKAVQLALKTHVSLTAI